MKKTILILMTAAAIFSSCGKDEPKKDKEPEVLNVLTKMDDSIFKKFCADKFDTNKDGVLTEEEAAAVTSIDVNNKKIASLSGIEYFTGLKDLNCSDNKITKLDITKCTALVNLDCKQNQIAALDPTKCTALVTLDCRSNAIAALDLSNCLDLVKLLCYSNKITKLDVSKNTAITEIDCEDNMIDEIDISKMDALTLFDASPMKDASGKNTLKKVYINISQLIEGVTVNRSTDNIPEETDVVIK